MRQGEQADERDMDDHHFLIGTYAATGRAKRQLENLARDITDKADGDGVSVREVRFFELSAHNEAIDILRDKLTELNDKEYFNKLVGDALEWAKSLLYQMTGIKSFKPSKSLEQYDTPSFDSRHLYMHVLGEHAEHSRLPIRKPEERDMEVCKHGFKSCKICDKHE